jgi:hypothetical protein
VVWARLDCEATGVDWPDFQLGVADVWLVWPERAPPVDTQVLLLPSDGATTRCEPARDGPLAVAPWETGGCETAKPFASYAFACPNVGPADSMSRAGISSPTINEQVEVPKRFMMDPSEGCVLSVADACKAFWPSYSRRSPLDLLPRAGYRRPQSRIFRKTQPNQKSFCILASHPVDALLAWLSRSR